MPAPERLLYVKPVIGNTYAAVAASAALSGWVQTADRTAGFEFPTHDTPPLLAGYSAAANGQSADDAFVFDADHAAAWRVFVAGGSKYAGPGVAGVTGATPGGLRFSHSGGMISGTYPGDPPDDDPFYFVDSHSVLWMPTATFLSVNSGQSLWSDAWRPSYPAGAIGYEVEQYELDDGSWAPLSDPISARVTLTLRDVSSGGEFFGAVTTLAFNDAFGTGFTDPAPNFNRDNAARDTHALIEAPVGAPDFNADVAVDVTVADFTSAPTRSGLFAMWLSVTVPDELNGAPDSWPNTNNISLVSQMREVVTTYTIRPPRIRWIFDTVPYRRTYPRDDALAGGAARNYPPSRAIQSGNRTSGACL